MITRSDDSLQILLYYDIPPAQWKEDAPTALSFYEGFPSRRVILELTGLPKDSTLLLKESRLNYQDGSAYEAWLRSGESLLPCLPKSPYTSQPLVRVRKADCQEGSLTYQCEMLPFEIRLVEVFLG